MQRAIIQPRCGYAPSLPQHPWVFTHVWNAWMVMHGW